MMWFFWVPKLEDFAQVLWMVLDSSVDVIGKLYGNDWPAKSALDWVRENARFTSLLLFCMHSMLAIKYAAEPACDSNARIHGS